MTSINFNKNKNNYAVIYKRNHYQLLIFSLLFLLVVSGCRKAYIQPTSLEGRSCVSQAHKDKQECVQQAQDIKSSCIKDQRHSANVQYNEAMVQYNSVLEPQFRNCMSAFKERERARKYSLESKLRTASSKLRKCTSVKNKWDTCANYYRKNPEKLNKYKVTKILGKTVRKKLISKSSIRMKCGQQPIRCDKYHREISGIKSKYKQDPNSCEKSKKPQVNDFINDDSCQQEYDSRNCERSFDNSFVHECQGQIK